MKKVKELKKWIELYGEVHAAAEELELAYEYVKEEIITCLLYTSPSPRDA